MPLKKNIEAIKNEFYQQLSKASAKEQLENIDIQFLGRNGKIAQLMKSLATLQIEEKRLFGPIINDLKKECQDSFEKSLNQFKNSELELEQSRLEQFDVTAYHKKEIPGTLHPYSHILEQIENVFITMGYEIADGPEVETDYYNFEALNIPRDHPARDMQDTFWLHIPQLLLRTHTSPIQIRSMEARKPPIALLASGRTYRYEATDASHDFMFGQVELLFVDKGVSLSHAFGTAKIFLQAIFEKKDLEIRIRPGYFPFVEPGVEIDMSCPFCKNGCSVCKKSGWIEMCGAGLVHPNVLKYCGIDPNTYSGFAFGFGLTRLAMLKYKIHDVRFLSSLSIDILKQF